MAHKQFLQYADIEEGLQTLGVDPDTHNVNFVLLGKVPGSDRPMVNTYIMKIENKYKGMKAVSRFLERMHQLSNISVNNCAAFIETQDARYTGKTNAANPQDLITLATMTGCISGLLAHHHIHSIQFVMPSTWKGQVPKNISHARICSALGWNYDVNTAAKTKQVLPKFTVCHNSDGGEIKGLYESGNTGAFFSSYVVTEDSGAARLPNKGEWMDVMDSVGLALYGMGTIKEQADKARAKMADKK